MSYLVLYLGQQLLGLLLANAANKLYNILSFTSPTSPANAAYVNTVIQQ